MRRDLHVCLHERPEELEQRLEWSPGEERGVRDAVDIRQHVALHFGKRRRGRKLEQERDDIQSGTEQRDVRGVEVGLEGRDNIGG